MNDPALLRVAEALSRYYAARGLPADGGVSARRWTPLAGLPLRLRNFGWRRRAIAQHDLHHLLTGYPCTAVGEFQMAAWEFAAGRFPSAASTLFCLPLVGLGAVLAPARTFQAYVRGRRSNSLYRLALRQQMLDLSLSELRAKTLPARQPRAGLRDCATYAVLVLLSIGLMLAPLAALCLVRVLL
jgi:hypothetical protein